MATRRTKATRARAKPPGKAGARSTAAKKSAAKKAAAKKATNKKAADKKASSKPADKAAAGKKSGASKQAAKSRSAAGGGRKDASRRTDAAAALATPRRPPAPRPGARPGPTGRATPAVKPAARPTGGRGVAVPGVAVTGRLGPRYHEILTPQALDFVADLHRKFEPTRKRLMAARAARQKRFDAGVLPDFPADTKHIRDDDWKVAPIPHDLLDRRVEITGPVDRKMVINALNSGANVFMADFEDANSPTWENTIEGQINLKDRWADRLGFTDPETGKSYALGPNPAVLIVRPRGWHLPEQHVFVDGEPMSGALFDFGLYFFHNAKAADRPSRHRPLFLSAQDREPPRGAAVERRVRLRPAQARHSARDDQGDGADRDAAGRVRDGRDPLRAARPHGRAQLRPLGLYLLLHQEASPAMRNSCCPTARRW